MYGKHKMREHVLQDEEFNLLIFRKLSNVSQVYFIVLNAYQFMKHRL